MEGGAGGWKELRKKEGWVEGWADGGRGKGRGKRRAGQGDWRKEVGVVI